MPLLPEILGMIFENLAKPDVKSARLVCKDWEAQTPRLLFNSVFIAARYADLEVAEKVISRFGMSSRERSQSSTQTFKYDKCRL